MLSEHLRTAFDKDLQGKKTSVLPSEAIKALCGESNASDVITEFQANI